MNLLSSRRLWQFVALSLSAVVALLATYRNIQLTNEVTMIKRSEVNLRMELNAVNNLFSLLDSL